MPRYEYQCPANGKSVVVRHCKSQTMSTWGDLCASGQILSDEAPGTPMQSPVVRVQQLACGNGVVHAEGECCGGSHHDDCHEEHAH